MAQHSSKKDAEPELRKNDLRRKSKRRPYPEAMQPQFQSILKKEGDDYQFFAVLTPVGNIGIYLLPLPGKKIPASALCF